MTMELTQDQATFLNWVYKQEDVEAGRIPANCAECRNNGTCQFWRVIDCRDSGRCRDFIAQ